MHDNINLSIRAKSTDDSTTREFYHNASAKRIFTPALIADSLAQQYPNLPIHPIPASFDGEVSGCDLLSYAALGFAEAKPIEESNISPLKMHSYIPPARRMDEGQGAMVEEVIYAKYWYSWGKKEYLLYVVSGRDGTGAPYPPTKMDLQFLIGPSEDVVKALVKDVIEYENKLHDEIWVFDGGFWRKDKGLYQTIVKSSWDDVILSPSMKTALQTDVLRFFKSRERYENLRVPWKRGIIYYGPPGNGKTVSIKATMHTLNELKDPIPSLYVRSLRSIGGPEYSIGLIFRKARQEAPCLLIFEDLDSLVGDEVRSYFLNEVDGLQVNDGVLMIGSTNHLDQLDPGISKRPSRFDRKYEFEKPNLSERILYCEYWRRKLSSNKDIEFPEKLCKAIAEETDRFSFAYIQEAFVASLLAIANRGEEGEKEEVWDREAYHAMFWGPKLEIWRKAEKREKEYREEGLERYVLWREIKRQIKNLREEM